jgi:hypothetical protein
MKKDQNKLIAVSRALVFIGACGLGMASGEESKAANEKEKIELFPTGLTVVVVDFGGKVIDTLIVPNDSKSYEINFVVSENTEGMKIFVLGDRVDKSIPPGLVVKGLSKKEGLGKVVVNVEEGKVTGIAGNGYGTLEFTDEMKKKIAADIKEGKKADFTSIEEVEDED